MAMTFHAAAAESKTPGFLALTWASIVPWGLAVIYFANGLTRPTGTARVTWHGQDPPMPEATGWIEGAAGEGVFHFWLVDSIADRSMTRLALVATLVTIGIALLGASRMILSLRAAGAVRSWGIRRAWRTWSAAAACAGAVVPLATWLQSQTVLAAAGGPPGLEPSAGLGWGWLAAAAACLLASRTASPASPRLLPPPSRADG
ncbi:hypothetical protein ACNI3K_11485 [Demequina sp. SO4-13]|uniref:hypothetical protein n=1 Tax=Demequina sp. SO4-13 TaxID=3401027 RepID=UPI003AF9977D